MKEEKKITIMAKSEVDQSFTQIENQNYHLTTCPINFFSYIYIYIYIAKLKYNILGVVI